MGINELISGIVLAVLLGAWWGNFVAVFFRPGTCNTTQLETQQRMEQTPR